jgi:uncharacterized repeat protein (TIGR01451 family)/fimbrial isopeptide formation D2 family protein
MDSAGTWDTVNDRQVTDDNPNAAPREPDGGDIFTFTVRNTGDDFAYDVELFVDLPNTGFRLPYSPFPVFVNEITGNPGCNLVADTVAMQSGDIVTINLPNNTRLGFNTVNQAAGCTYEFVIGLTTDDNTPATAGAHAIDYHFSYRQSIPSPRTNVVETQIVTVNRPDLVVTKTALTTSAANGQAVDFDIVIQNLGSGGTFNVELDDTITANLTGLTFDAPVITDTSSGTPVAIAYTTSPTAPYFIFSYLPPNPDIEISIGAHATATVDPLATTCPDMINTASVQDQSGFYTSNSSATVDFNLSGSLQLTYNLASSYCELCGLGQVDLRVENVGGILLTNIELQQNFLNSGLTYAGNAQVSTDGGANFTAINGPLVSGANNSILQWTYQAGTNQVTELAELYSPFIIPAPPGPTSLVFRFNVARDAGLNEEDLISAVRNMQATADYTLNCNGLAQYVDSGFIELPIRQPEPLVSKLGWNIDAGQLEGTATDIVYGHLNDDVVWRIEIQNNGDANLEDLLLNETIDANFDLYWVCNSATAATNAEGQTTGPTPAGCLSVQSSPTLSELRDVDDPLGNPNNDEDLPSNIDVDVPANGTTVIYYVGITDSACTQNVFNTATIAWGCQEDSPPAGGITSPATNNGIAPATTITDNAQLSTNVINSGLDIVQQVTGIDGAQPVGSKGLVTIQFTNLTGGTIRNIDFTDTLPTQYVVDYTWDADGAGNPVSAVVAPAYGNVYGGMIDTIAWDNQDADPLNNIAPHFTLTSSTTGDFPANDQNLLRHGDVLTIQFRIVLIDAPRYDLVADLDVAPEIQGDGTDPDSDFQVTNSIHVNFDDICGNSNLTRPDSVQNFPADVEDLDVSISDPLFILTNNTTNPLPLHVDLTNNGGHDADDYFLYVSFGQAMEVQTPAPGCTLPVPNNPPAHPTWNIPDTIPGPLNGLPPATVYLCNRGVIAPGATERFTFEVVKQTTGSPADDLTFRADVIGEITLSDGTLLTFPAPISITETSPNQQLANNYTLDGVRSRVLGFNLTQNVWYCTESGTAEPTTPTTSDDLSTIILPVELNTQIGEDCHYFLEAGGWFGFDTPGFSLIAVRDVDVTAGMEGVDIAGAFYQGLGSIPFGPASYYDFYNTTPEIVLDIDANGGATTTQLSQSSITWQFNGTIDIEERDKFFRVNYKNRLLNWPVNLAYPVPGGYQPNLHGRTSTNIATASFNAIFEDDITGTNFNVLVDETTGVPGYPPEVERRVDLEIVEPNLQITKYVCNESRSTTGTGVNCTPFELDIDAAIPADNPGDTQDSYVYLIEIVNEVITPARSPAYDVIVTDLLDSSDLMLIAPGGPAPFDNDGLDNDGDGLVDTPAFGGNDTDGEYTSLTENSADGPPNPAASFVISYQHSSALQRIDEGAPPVRLYYRIDPDDAVAPLQTLDNTVDVTYDSLDGDFGNQNSPQLLNTNTTFPTGHARVYDAIQEVASAQMVPLQTQPKSVVAVSSSGLTGAPQNVVVGEEVEYRLTTLLPVANLRNFTIYDELPPGITCIEAPNVNLQTDPLYTPAGFVPGVASGDVIGDNPGEITCDGNTVQWNFGDQELTADDNDDALFPFQISFIARVENIADIQNGCYIRNGLSSGDPAPTPTPCGGSTETTVIASYVDESGGTITLNFAARDADLVVREPNVTITKSFAPVTQADADDILNVTVTATNNSPDVSAFNLQVLDDLTGTNMTYIGNETGDVPDNIDITTLGANQPIFNWDTSSLASYELTPGESTSFTFQVQVDPVVQPLEVLDNGIEARWTSLEFRSTRLNSLGDLPVDGEILGMRTGQLSGVPLQSPAAIANAANNDYDTSASAFVTVPPVTISKTDLTPAVLPEIGAVKQFQLVITFPEGITDSVLVTDELATGSARYVIENNADYDISYNFQGIETINGQPPSEAAFGADPLVDTDGGFPQDNDPGPAVAWDIRQVDTGSAVSPATVNPQITITYYARINNDDQTDRDDTLENAARVEYTNGEDATVTEIVTAASVGSITVIESDLQVAKGVTNLTQGVGVAPDGGDVLEYVITINNNNGNATAYDINITDALPAGLLRDETFIPTATIDGSPVVGFVPVPTNSPAGPLIWGRGNGDDTLDLPAGSELLLTYRSIVQYSVEPLQQLDNTVVIDWTSLQGSSALIDARERTGPSDCAAITPPDDYCRSDSASETVSNLYNITKDYDSDTWNPAANDRQLRVGDRVQYTLTISMQEGTASNVSIVDNLPNGMEFVTVDSINGDTGTGTTPNRTFADGAPFEYVGDSIIAESTDIIATTGAGANTVTFNIGDLIVNSGNLSSVNNFVIVYTAQVVNDELPIPQAPATPVTNVANFNYDQATTPPDPQITQTDSETIDVLQPQILLSDISKERYDSSYSASLASGSAAPSGSFVYFRLNVCNSGDAPAYDAVIVDDLNPIAGTSVPQIPVLTSEFDLSQVSTPEVYINGALATEDTGSGGDYTYNLVGSVMTFSLTGASIAPAGSPNNCAVIEYNVQVDPTLAGGNSWDNSLQVNSYSSINVSEPDVGIRDEREIYDTVVGPVLHNLHNIDPLVDPSKAFIDVQRPDTNPAPITARAATDAAIGELVTYRVVVPATGMNGALNNVVIIDNLNPALTFDSASLVFNTGDPLAYGSDAGGTETISTSYIGNQLRVSLDDTLQGQHQATVDVVARVDNNASADLSTTPFGNSVQYEFTNSASPTYSGLVTTAAANDISIVEPQLDLTAGNQPTITVTNLTSALPTVDAGDILEYTITYRFLGGAAGDAYSDAYDVSISSDIGPGLEYIGVSRSEVFTSPTSSVLTNPTPGTVGNVLTWDVASGTDIDVPEGVNASFSFRVQVRDTALAAQTLSNTTTLRWSSLDDDIADVDEQNERAGGGGVDDYFYSFAPSQVTTTNANTIDKSLVGNTSPLAGPNDVRIGDFVEYRIRLSLQEGLTQNVRISDVLPRGQIYEGLVTVNGIPAPFNNVPPFTHNTISDVAAVGDPATGTTTVTWNIGDITNPGVSINDGNNNFDIVYRARVLNNVQTPLDDPASNIDLRNDVSFTYEIWTSDTSTADYTLTSDETILIQQPNLSVAKTVATQFVGSEDYEVSPNELVTYTVIITNNGQSPAYDAVLTDTLPLGLRQAGIVDLEVQLPVGNIVPQGTEDLIVTSYDAATGVVQWNFDTGVSDSFTIQPGQQMQVTYTVQADAGIGASLTGLVNTAQVSLYYSYDDEDIPPNGLVTQREEYGPSNIATATGLTTPGPVRLAKQNPAITDVSIGLPFTYTITVPETPSPTALYDVKILDNITNLAANLVPNLDADGVFITLVDVQRVSGSTSWTPVNTGSSIDLVIEDLTNGIDIPAGEQVVIELTLVLQNRAENRAGDTFSNIAGYTFNRIDNDESTRTDGDANPLPPVLTIVEPFLEIIKTGPGPAPNNIAIFGQPIPYRLVIHNTGSAPAYDITVTDTLPDQADPLPPPAPVLTGGTCDTIPDTFTAEVFAADETTSISGPLQRDVDFTANYTAAPTCELVITALTPIAGVGPDEKLIVTYNTYLDVDSQSNAQLTNNVAVTQYFSADTPAGTRVGEIKEYVNDATSAADESQYTVVVAAPDLDIVKSVENVSRGSPGDFAEPGDRLAYTIVVTNNGQVAATNFSVRDEVDRLNAAPGYFDVPGSISNVTVSVPATFNIDNNGGAQGSGVLDVQVPNLAAGGASMTVRFEVILDDRVMDSGTLVLNQAEVSLAGFNTLLSDSDDTDLTGDSDPTRTIIGSIPVFDVRKRSEDVTGDSTVLVSGDTLRYTITAQNIGAENAVNTILRDQIPANTSYVANSTTLNGTSVADPAAGVSPLQDGMLINAPEDPTPGNMRASSSSTTNIATIVFDVTINSNVVNGTVISNQGVVAGDGVGSGPFPEQFSDDPDTEIVGDPTRDVVGNVPILDAQKIVSHYNDVDGDGLVEVGDTLRYTIIVSNSGTRAANGVRLLDAVPADTTYVTNSVTLNGDTVSDTVPGVSPLIAGIDISSADLTPPLPNPLSGVINPAQSAVVTFDVVVATVPASTPPVISNQGRVTSAEFPDELTDADGNDLNGDQPTEIIVGGFQRLSIRKEVNIVGGGTVQPGSTLEYFIRVENTGSAAIDLDTSDVLIDTLKVYDDIDTAHLDFVTGSATLNGAPTPNITYVLPRLTVNYDSEYSGSGSGFVFEPGDTFTIRYLARVRTTGVSQGDLIRNPAGVDWGVPSGPVSCLASTISNVDACASVDIAVGGAPGVANLSGNAWHDRNFDLTRQNEEASLEGWEVEIYFGTGNVNPGDYLDSVFVDANGEYNINGLVPNTGDLLRYALRFRAPGSSTDTASLGNTDSAFADGPQQITFFNIGAGSHTTALNMPIQPNGVVYNSIDRTPVPGAVLQLFNNNGGLVPDTCFNDPAQQYQRTVDNGFYKFELLFNDTASCGSGEDYVIHVIGPADYLDYDDNDQDTVVDYVSRVIPPVLPATDPGLDVPTCSIDAISATAECEVQVSEQRPPTTQAPRTPQTGYYLKLNLASAANDDQLYNNHIPLDPEMGDAIGISKTSALVNVTRSQLVPYTITLSNAIGVPVYDLNVIDNYPAGFKYVENSARIYINDQRVIDPTAYINVETIEPQRLGLQLYWPNMFINTGDTITIKMLLVVGSGVGEGEYVNRVQAFNNRTLANASGEASATVRVVPDPTFDCSDVLGKVFDDGNMNGHQDEGEKGIPSARVISAQGLEATTDEFGRFHITCAVVPNPDRGSNFILKLDERSLPTGYRVISENPRVQRATRGKMLKYNFATAIHRVVRLDMADGVFEPRSTEMRVQWKPRLDLLISELAKDSSVLRLSYMAEVEDPDLVDDRVEAVKQEISKRWEELNCCYKLLIETEVFWRTGAPPDRGEIE